MHASISNFNYLTQNTNICKSISRDIIHKNPAMTPNQESDLLNRFGTFINTYDRTLDLSNLNITTIPASLNNAGQINVLTLSPNFIFEQNAAPKLSNINSITVNQNSRLIELQQV